MLSHSAGDPTCIAWHLPDRLPENTVRYDALGTAHYLKGKPFHDHGAMTEQTRQVAAGVFKNSDRVRSG